LFWAGVSCGPAPLGPSPARLRCAPLPSSEAAVEQAGRQPPEVPRPQLGKPRLPGSAQGPGATTGGTPRRGANGQPGAAGPRPCRADRGFPRAGAMVEKNLERCQNETEEVTQIMLVNYSKVLDREAKLSDLDDRADELRNMSSTFSKTTKTVAQKKRWENRKYKIVLAVVVVVVVLIILAVVLWLSLRGTGNQAAESRAAGNQAAQSRATTSTQHE
ncbi:vesicle associated membrane protein 5, partial [Chelydra serpentina]